MDLVPLANMFARGCVTPQMIANLNDTIDGDLEMLDGYDEIDEESQEKVRKALKDGHVADEDWNGVSCEILYQMLDTHPYRTLNKIALE